MDTISILTKKRQRIERYEIEVEGEQRERHPRLYTHITVTHILSGPAIDDAAVLRSIELSATKYCVVSATIATGQTRIEHQYRISDESGERTGAGASIGPRGAGLILDEAP